MEDKPDEGNDLRLQGAREISNPIRRLLILAFLTLLSVPRGSNADLEVWRLRASICFHECAVMEGLNKSSKPLYSNILWLITTKFNFKLSNKQKSGVE